MILKTGKLENPPYRADIDGLRAVAVLSVVVHHAFQGLAPGGFAGVDVFFVISGFLISGIIYRSVTGGTFSYADFYARRIRRILPALILVLVASLVAGWFLLRADHYAMLGKHTAAGAAFIANVSLRQDTDYFGWDARSIFMLHLWSLAIEEQFYIFWPILMQLAWRGGRWGILASVVVAGIASLGYGIANHVSQPVDMFFSPIARAWELMAGALIAIAPGFGFARMLGSRILREAASVAGLVLIATAIFYLTPLQAFAAAAVAVVGAALLISAGPACFINRYLLGNRVIVWFGLISYPLYLWHWPLLAFAYSLDLATPRIVRLALVVLSVILAWLTYRYVERPIRFKNAVSPLAIATALGCTAFAALAIWLSQGFPNRAVARTPENVFLQHYATVYSSGVGEAYRFECDFKDHTGDGARVRIADSCTTPGAAGTWMLWGDSHGQALSSGIRAILPTGFALAQVATSGCAPNLGLSDATVCGRSNVYAKEAIRKLRPSVLFLVQSIVHEDTDWHAFATFAHENGVRDVVLIGPVPQWRPSLPRMVVNHHFHDDKVHVPEGLDPAMIRTDAILAKRYARDPDIRYISLIAGMCNQQGCLARIPAPPPFNLVALDYGHLSPEAAVYLARTIIAKELKTP